MYEGSWRITSSAVGATYCGNVKGKVLECTCCRATPDWVHAKCAVLCRCATAGKCTQCTVVSPLCFAFPHSGSYSDIWQPVGCSKSVAMSSVHGWLMPGVGIVVFSLVRCTGCHQKLCSSVLVSGHPAGMFSAKGCFHPEPNACGSG